MKRRQTLFSGSSVASVALEAEIDECHHRLLSGEILMSTAASNTAGKGNRSSREVAVQPFIEAFDGELNRLANAISNHRFATESSAEALLKNVDGLYRRKGKLSDAVLSEELVATRKIATALQGKTLRIINEKTKNEKELHRIALEADSKLGTSCVDESERQFAKEPWEDRVSAGHIVKLLSDIFSLIREIEDDGKQKGDKWVAPTSFERVTTKYWIRKEDFPEVLLKSASELPILVYGKSGLLTKNPKDPSEGKKQFWKSLASPISSVYFDSENMDLYKERIKRSEGAQLFRVRWYGNKPKSDDVIFLELKTHHECWIDNKSVKERVGIVEKRMLMLMDTSSGPWASEYAKELVLEANPDASEEESGVSTALLLVIRDLFCKLKLRACVRTSYSRAAFQSAKNNNLRLTIDRDITVIDETKVQNEGSWCIEDNDVVPIEAFVKVPYGVFEVKVSDGKHPLFIEELQASDAIVEAPKFSKFLTGASLHNADKVNMLPWWAEDALFAPIFKMRQMRESSSRRNSASNASSRRNFALNANAGRALSVYKVGTCTSKTIAAEENNEKLSPYASDLTAAEEGRTMKSIVGDGKTNRGLFGFVGMRSRHNTPKDKTPVAAPRSPARVEPKSFFANERTFINWITVGSMFMFVASIIYSEAVDLGSYRGQSLMNLGTSLIACAMFVVVYGSMIYYRRLYLMINAKPYGYADTFGPAVLATFMIGLLASFIYVMLMQFPVRYVQLVGNPGVCVQRNLDLGITSGISALQFEPSDVIVDEGRNLLIVVSLDDIVAVPSGLPTDEATINAPMQVLHKFPDGTEDLEALEIINDTIYAISEGKKDSAGNPQSDIITLDWTSDGLLNVTNRWRINAPSGEGMAYTPDPNWFETPKLIVAADTRSIDPVDRLKLSAFLIPLPVNGEPPLEARLNNKFFVNELLDTKVAAMQFFRGLLYMLYDNAQKIRAYNNQGHQVNEWVLPIGVGFYDKMWEGMRLEQEGNELYLHLTLDSPPSIWSIKLEGNTSPNSVNGQWNLPACASF